MINPNKFLSEYNCNTVFAPGDIVEVLKMSEDYLSPGKRYVVIAVDIYSTNPVQISCSDSYAPWLHVANFKRVQSAEPWLLEEGDYVTLQYDLENEDGCIFEAGDYPITEIDMNLAEAGFIEISNENGALMWLTRDEVICAETGKIQMPDYRRELYDEYLK